MKSIFNLFTKTENKPSEPPKIQDQPNLFNETYRFAAVDVETANKNQDSICQIGIAMTDLNGNIKDLGILIDPEQGFDDFNITLHGIDHKKVDGALNFPQALQMLRPFLERHLLIQHSSFDKRAFDAACEKYQIPALRSKWFDSVLIARKAWPELKGNGGHGLSNLKKHLKLDFEHHDAKEDARAAAEVTLLAESRTGKTFDELAQKARNKFQPAITLEGNQNGQLYGHIACFTGQLSMSRVDAATHAAGAGIAVKANVTKKTTLLVVGDQDMTILAGHDKSSKHRRTEQLMEEGQEIRILGESEFLGLIKS